MTVALKAFEKRMGQGDKKIMTETLIKIENLHKSFGKNEVLKGINLEIKRGEVVVIIGPRGAGNLPCFAL